MHVAGYPSCWAVVLIFARLAIILQFRYIFSQFSWLRIYMKAQISSISLINSISTWAPTYKQGIADWNKCPNTENCRIVAVYPLSFPDFNCSASRSKLKHLLICWECVIWTVESEPWQYRLWDNGYIDEGFLTWVNIHSCLGNVQVTKKRACAERGNREHTERRTPTLV